MTNLNTTPKASTQAIESTFGFKAKAAAKIAAVKAETQRREAAEKKADWIIRTVSEEAGFSETAFFKDCERDRSLDRRTKTATQIFNNIRRMAECSEYLQSIGALEYINELGVLDDLDAQEAYIHDFLTEEILDEIDDLSDTDLDLAAHCKGMALCAALYKEFEDFKSLEEEHDPKTPFIKEMMEKLEKEDEEHMSYML